MHPKKRRRTVNAIFSGGDQADGNNYGMPIAPSEVVANTRRWKMSLFVWILLGLVSGFIASHLVNRRGEGMVLDILLGIVGAIVGGWLFHWFGREGVNGLNVHSFF